MGETLHGKTGPVLLVANHPNSLFDPALVLATAGRRVRFLAKAPLFDDWRVAWIVKYPLYPAERPQPTTVVPGDVLLMRGTFDLPPAKEGHRYRVRVSGSINANSGEGFAIYVNGRRMGERKTGVTGWRRQGTSGSPVWSEFMEDFKGGPVTLAIANFPMNNHSPGRLLPAIGPLSVTIEEQKMPDLKARL